MRFLLLDISNYGFFYFESYNFVIFVLLHILNTGKVTDKLYI